MVEHVGMVISGCATAAMDDGRVIEMRAGDVFYIGPGHYSWVLGDEPYVSLHFLGAEEVRGGQKRASCRYRIKINRILLRPGDRCGRRNRQ
jgi:hypothetical protein